MVYGAETVVPDTSRRNRNLRILHEVLEDILDSLAIPYRRGGTTHLAGAIYELESLRDEVPKEIPSNASAFHRNEIRLLINRRASTLFELDSRGSITSVPFNPRPELERRTIWPATTRYLSTVGDAVQWINYFDIFGFESGLSNDTVETTISVEGIRAILPDQREGPAKFDFDGNKIVVVNQSPSVPQEDKQSIESAFKHVTTEGEAVLSALSKSNCDPRLFESLSRLQRCIDSRSDIIQLGLVNTSVQALANALESEIPDALLGLITGHIRSVSLYVAQFEDWRRFALQAVTANLTPVDAAIASSASEKLVSQLENSPLAAPEVPQTIALLREAVARPGVAGMRAVFALIRALENLLSRIVHHFEDFLEKTAAKTVNAMSSAGAILTVSLVSIALGGLASMAPLATRLEGGAWLQKALEAVQKQLDSLPKP